MKKKGIAKASRLMLLMMAAIMLIGAIPMTNVQASTYQSANIQRVEGLKVDYKDYIDESVVFQLPDTIDPEEEISVIITTDIVSLMDAYEATDKTMSFSEYVLESEEADEIRNQVAGRKAQILARLDEMAIAYSTGEDYDTVLTGFEILIKASDFEAACMSLDDGENAVIGEVYHRAETKLVENTVNIFTETGIFNSSSVAYDGSGMVVAVLDTGLDSNHTAYSVENFTSQKLGLTYQDVAAVVADTRAYEQYGGLGVDDVYINEKVPFGYDYADNDPDVYSTHNNHGTHVSGVIVGKDDVITGVAPNAQLVSMKIFSDVVDTARASWILSALEDCVILGVDVINMSLGTAAGFSRESDEEIVNGVYDKIRAAGISVVAAASNSYSSAYGSDANGNLGLTTNPDTGTVGSPSTYEGVLSVASISGTETPYLLYNDTIIYFDESNNAGAEENNFCETLLGEEESIEIEYVVIPGVGRSADYSGLDVAGKIALVRRGDNTFEEKAMIAEAQGAAGIIIYNNVSGEIKMNVGDAKLAVCSISQDNGEMLVAAGSGKLKISKQQTSGPFISDFSSWGPTPSLEIKPEITGHGGNILSSVTGGGYDRLSGTSMACPNLAGVVILLRQYVVENFPDIANDNVEVAAMVNRLLMSTADIALNTNGQPYAVRKQGAGLANLVNATETPAYITTYRADGTEMDKSKLELGDDIEKTGVYEMSFTVNNVGDKSLSYDLGAYVMTEGVSDTKTNAGKTTVTEEAYILDGATVEILTINGEEAKSANKISVDAGSTTDVTVRITLSDADKAYLDESFGNGMYVEGYLTLTATKGTKINLNVPYLAYYGDWTQAPLFDLEYYDTNADELDDGINEEDKLKADAYATRAVGGISGDYVSYLGSYYFLQDPDDMVISANKDYISLSNQEGTVHALRYVWAGLLRNAAKVVVTITDDNTGEVIFETEDVDVRKSYGDGGSIYPANIEIEFDIMDYNLPNNSTYTVKLEGYTDYGNGGLETNLKNTFEIPLTVDFEAPVVSDVEFYYEYDKNLSKNRLYAKAAIFDNHHAMSAQLGYVGTTTDEDGNEVAEMKSFEQNMTPVYSQRNDTTYVTFELTDHIYEIKENSINKNSFVITTYDYALNYATYEISLPDDYTDFYFDSLAEGITMSPNEVISLEPLVYPSTEWSELLEFTSSKPSVARIVNNKLVATASGTAMVKVRDPQSNQDITFKVTVLDEDDEGYRRLDKPVADVFQLTGYYTSKAYYQLSSEDKEIGDTGDTRYFGGNYSLSLYPSESVYLLYRLDSYFPNDTTVEFETSNDSIVSIDESGCVTAKAEGFASVTIKVMMDGRSTYYSETVSVEVKDPYITTGASLTHYFGNGGVVMIPEDLSLREIGAFAFANFEYIEKTPEELEFDDAETSKQWYIGDGTVTKVVIPEGVEKINQYAFANLTALEEIVLPSTLNAIEYGAFYGCTSLQKITFSGENNLQIINQNAFENCDLQGTVDLSAVCIISAYAFAGNQDLEGIVTSEDLLSIGQYAFAGCKSLTDVTITAEKVKYGTYAFTDCEALTSFYVNASVLPEGMFYEAKSLETVTIGPDVNTIGEFAFRDTAVTTLEVAAGSSAFKVQSADYVLSADGKTLVAVAPTVRGAYTAANIGGAAVTVIGDGAFSHNTKVTSVELPAVEVLGDYAFGSSESLTSVNLGTLTNIGEYAFFETSITELPQFTADAQLGKYAFAFTDLTTVTIPDGMTIGEGAFSQCLSLVDVVIGSDVTIGDYAFFVDKDYAFTVESYEEEIEVAGAVAVPGEEEEHSGEVMEEDDTVSLNPEEDNSEEEQAIAFATQQEKYFYYTFATAMKTLTIGDNALIGDHAFAGAASLETVTLGANAEIGEMAFYNNASLKEIDLSAVKSIGNYAFSGDVYYICVDDSMTYAAISPDGYYIYTYHAPQIETADLSVAESVGEYAFSYCRQLKDVKLNSAITEIAPYTFAGCEALETINLDNIVTVGDYAFIENKALTEISLPVAESIGEYAFVYCENLTTVNLSAEGTDIAEGVFTECGNLAQVGNLDKSKSIGDFSFALTAVTEADLTGAEYIGSLAFMKEELTPFQVTLGENLTELGDNPFALCQVEPFGLTETSTFNQTEVTTSNNTYEISDSVRVIDGSLYCDTVNGMELVTFAGTTTDNVKIAEDTVRITAYAFAGSDVQMVTLPVSTTSVGHKAFFGCEGLHTVVFGSQVAPVLEEEYDSTYYESLEHIPGSGDFGTYTDYNGAEVTIEPMGLVPYFMWNATGGLYSNVYYGANFVDYVGYVEDKLTMVRPVNGQNYDSFIMSQYFDTVIDGPAAPDKTTLAAIKAIKAIPEKVGYEDAALVEAARAAYTKIATLQQQSLVTNYADLISAEQRIIALTPTEEGAEDQTVEEENVEAMPEAKDGTLGLLLILAGTLLVIGGYFAVVNKSIKLEDLKKIDLKRIKLKKPDLSGLKNFKLMPALKKLGAWFAKAGAAVASGCVKGIKWLASACKALIAKLPKKAKAESTAEAETEQEETVTE